jgi:hypothetical protein
MTATPVNKTKFTSSENYRLACRGDLVPFRSAKPNVSKTAVVFCPDTKNKPQLANKSVSPVNQSPFRNG